MSAISVSWLDVSWGAVYIETNCGLMQHSFIEIKNKLLRALDSEYNVVDMATVFEVVAVLEKTPITPEILETTRLGKVINECRRRTNNEVLAKRAKHLLRYWRNMMIAPNAEKSSSSLLSPSSSVSVVASSATVPHQNGTARSANALKVVDRVPTPSISPALSSSSSVSRNSNIYDSKISPASSLSPIGEHKIDPVPKTHVANKRLRKNASSPGVGEPAAKVSKMNGAMFSDRAAVPDVSGENSVDCDLSRLRESVVPVNEDLTTSSCGQTVVTESVPEPDPPLPKKRSRKKGNKKKPQADDNVKEKLHALSKTARVKTTEELVAELKSRSEDRLLATTSDIANKTSLSNSVSGELPVDEQKLDPETRVEREIANILSKLPPVNIDEIIWHESEEELPQVTKTVTEEDVDRYLKQSWEGVNGCVTHSASNEGKEDAEGDGDNRFREWHEMIARRSTNDDLIHVLPYSIVD